MAGLNWHPLWDKFSEASPSVGAIAIAPSDPNVIYVGTGEACIRGNIVMGNGVYKSTDAGKTWKYSGLRDTHSIGRMIVHPKDPNTVYVAALGHPFGPNTTRGVFRSRDGGKNLAAHPVCGRQDRGHRHPVRSVQSQHSVRRDVAGSAQAVDHGVRRPGQRTVSFRRRRRHLDQTHRQGFAGRHDRTHWIATTPNPNRIYALIEAEKGGLFRSDDGGEKWELINEDRRYRQRAWYYTHVFADPKNPDVVYILNTGSYRSIDGGKTFNSIHTPHGDNHGSGSIPTIRGV